MVLFLMFMVLKYWLMRLVEIRVGSCELMFFIRVECRIGMVLIFVIRRLRVSMVIVMLVIFVCRLICCY